ncbi:MAG: hypothetical protein COA78_23255 [Blastopirellula sp.]|nr:MAG: hypothetical protein COA78_23255 [Blastopirellula sp.]
MLSGRSVRDKLMVGIALLFVSLIILATSALIGNYSYRGLARGVSVRASELPLAINFSIAVTDLRHTYTQAEKFQEFSIAIPGFSQSIARDDARDDFRRKYMFSEQQLRKYREQLDANDLESGEIGDSQRERKTIRKIDQSLEKVAALKEQNWLQDEVANAELERELDNLHTMAKELPTYLIEEMQQLKDDVRTQYRTLILISTGSTAIAMLLLALFAYLLWLWIYRPLKILHRESRRISVDGDFQHRIQLDTNDEMSTLADAMNDMTQRFEEIKNNLNEQVRERTKQVVHSEKMASVGFLAAGVAHEINNPLASIAFCAESLQARLNESMTKQRASSNDANTDNIDTNAENSKSAFYEIEEIEVLETYLGMIEEEAFRCKEITERLLDYSRIGDIEKHDTDLNELVKNVIDMVRHLGTYREKTIDFQCNDLVLATVNAPELKQVVLNLITNSLDSLDPGGTVDIRLKNQGNKIILTVSDNGCGMTEEVRKHLFEPFFTRRRDGQGTGLGLSITYRIITEHDGQIEATSPGTGQGTTFVVTLPAVDHSEEKNHQYKAA